MKLHREINMKKSTSEKLRCLARLISSLHGVTGCLCKSLSSFLICAAILTVSVPTVEASVMVQLGNLWDYLWGQGVYSDGNQNQYVQSVTEDDESSDQEYIQDLENEDAADSSDEDEDDSADIYNLPDGVDPVIISNADVTTIDIDTASQMKFLYAVDKSGTNLVPATSGGYEKALDWYDIPWATPYNYPVPVSDARQGTNYAIDAYNGSIVKLPSTWDSSNYEYLLAARIDNLQLKGGFYKFDFSVGIHVTGLDSSFQGALQGGASEASYQPLDLVTGNSFQSDRANRITVRNPKNTDRSNWVRPFGLDKSGYKEVAQPPTVQSKGRDSTGYPFHAFDGKMHSYWVSGDNDDRAWLEVDLGEEREIDKIVIRWKGEAEHYYKLRTAGEDQHYTTFYKGTVNPYNGVDVTTRGVGIDSDNNEVPASKTDWEKFNSYYFVVYNTMNRTDDVNEVFTVKTNETVTARYVKFQGLEPGDGQPYEILEFEVYAYDPIRSQTEDPRLFNYADRMYLLFNSTSDGKIYNDSWEAGNGRWQYVVEIVQDSTNVVESGVTNVVFSERADIDTLIRLNRPSFDLGYLASNNLNIATSRFSVEKNLTPFEADTSDPNAGKLMMVYGYDPLEVYEVDMTNGNMTLSSVLQSDVRSQWGGGTLGAIRGGTPALWNDDLGGYVTFFHSSTKEKFINTVGTQTNVVAAKYTYFTGALLFKWDDTDDGYRITDITPEPLVHPSWYADYNEEFKKVAFAVGVAEDSSNYYVSVGVADEYDDVATFNKTALSDEFVDVGEENTLELSDLDLYLVVGLSNMAGRAPIEAGDTNAIMNTFLFNSMGKFEPAYNPLNQYSTARKAGAGRQKLGPAGPFAEVLAAAYPSNKFGLVVNCRGGDSVETWLPDIDDVNQVDHPADGLTKMARYELSIAQIQRASFYGNLKGVLAIIGEGDVFPSTSTAFMSRLKTIIESYRNDLNRPNLPFICAEMCYADKYLAMCLNTNMDSTAVTYPYDPTLVGCNNGTVLTQWKPAFNAQLRTLVDPTSTNYVPYTAVVSSDGLTETSENDGTHFDNASVQLLGARFAAEAQVLIYGESP